MQGLAGTRRLIAVNGLDHFLPGRERSLSPTCGTWAPHRETIESGGSMLMHYRSFGNLDWKPSALGFGAMRLPVVGGDQARVDEAEAVRMIRHAIDRGVNYVDTAYTYHQGISESIVGRALRDGYRERVRLASKLPPWLLKSIGDCDRILGEQLQRLQTDHIDFYLMHGLNKDRWPVVRELKVLDWADKALADGRIHYLGFSFHDRLSMFEEILNAYPGWSFCQIQYNYVDDEFQAGMRGLRLAAGKGLGVVVMEPLRGGALASPPAQIQTILNASPHKAEPADRALQWVWNQPEVSLALSGMSSMEHVEQNLASAENSHVGALTEQDLALYANARVAYRGLRPIPCTDCQYCQPCPNNVDIPRVFETYNGGVMLGAQDRARFLYSLQKETDRANNCQECGECEEQCPQQIEIIQWLKKAHEYMK